MLKERRYSDLFKLNYIIYKVLMNLEVENINSKIVFKKSKSLKLENCLKT